MFSHKGGCSKGESTFEMSGLENALLEHPLLIPENSFRSCSQEDQRNEFVIRSSQEYKKAYRSCSQKD